MQKRCERCNKLFRCFESDRDRRRFCSMACKRRPSRKCERCQGSFIPRGASRRFCSRHCSKIGEQVSKKCKACGTVFSGPPSIMETRLHCSKKCQERRMTYACESCGKPRTVRLSQTAKRFCSNACRVGWFSTHFVGVRSSHWRGGSVGNYGPNWKTQRRIVRRRDGYKCQCCGVAQRNLLHALDVAHIVPFASYGLRSYKQANHESNLISFCRRCHLRYDYACGTRG